MEPRRPHRAEVIPLNPRRLAILPPLGVLPQCVLEVSLRLLGRGGAREDRGRALRMVAGAAARPS